ncbi:copper amine oxidase N-terminal domain-containing protein [Paenibacillus farraposensis]|uniref:Copper amine oxidase N-terminal domain-containing protein n=3 Tax=Paenibacillus farraposensis TaxID=2807095 RepID=A0ABW4DJJ8_9BACL|nr:copper amine oxidase N-terminal domain-containing protein [Paenibacillus farraposensis]
MKKFMGLIFSVVIVSSSISGSALAASPVPKVTVDQKAVAFPDAKPYVESNRVLIPVRFVSQALGAKVDYKNKTVLISQDGKSISMKVNSAIVTRDQDKLLLDVPARVQKNRVYVPLRFVSEALGAQVDWNKAKLLVAISTGTGAADPEQPEKKPEESKTFFKPFEWEEKTGLAKSLFKNNIRVNAGTVTFTVPADATASFYGDGKTVKLSPGKEYSYPLGLGSISFSRIYAAENYIEAYSVFLDTKHPTLHGQFDDVTGDAVVDHTLIKNEKMVGTAGTLGEVIAAAKSL